MRQGTPYAPLHGPQALDPIKYRRFSTLGLTKDASKGSLGWIWVTCLIRDMGLEHELIAELYPFDKHEDPHIITILLLVDRYQWTFEFTMLVLPILGLITHDYT